MRTRIYIVESRGVRDGGSGWGASAYPDWLNPDWLNPDPDPVTPCCIYSDNTLVLLHVELRSEATDCR